MQQRNDHTTEDTMRIAASTHSHRSPGFALAVRRLPWPTSLRAKLVTITTAAVLAGLATHLIVSSIAVNRLAESYWGERLKRETAFFGSTMNWWFDGEQNEGTRNWLAGELKNSVTLAYKINRDEKGQFLSVETTPRWKSGIETPIDANAVAFVSDEKNADEQTCICGGYRVTTRRDWANVVQYGIPVSLGTQLLSGFYSQSAASAIAGLAMAALMAALTGLALTRPLTALARRASRLESKDPIPNLERRDEVGQLARALDDGITKLRDARSREARFLASASHELRTPITALVVGLERDLARPRNADEAREALERAHKAALRLGDLSSNLLTLTRSSQAEPNRVDVDLRELASQVSDELMTLAIEKDLLIEVKGTSGKMRGDPTALKQVIANLIGNAIKFTDAGGITITVTSLPGGVQLSVEDTGMGFPTSDTEELRTLLEPFRRGHAAVRPGAGLGLAVVREVVDAHGGSVELSNREGGGARITITLPQTGTALAEVKA